MSSDFGDASIDDGFLEALDEAERQASQVATGAPPARANVSLALPPAEQ